MTTTEARLAEARTRLREALRAGADTGPHRQAVARLEAQIQQEAAAARAAQDDTDARAAATRAIEERAQAIAAELRGELASVTEAAE